MDDELRDPLDEDDENFESLPGYESYDETFDHEEFYDRVFYVGEERDSEEETIQDFLC